MIPATTNPKHFSISKHLTYPLITFLLVASLFEYFQFDLSIAQFIFNIQGGVDYWPLRDHWLTENLLHEGGRNFVILLGVLLLCMIGTSFRRSTWSKYRRSLICLFISALTSILLVKFIKDFTHVSCPWDVIQFGGSVPYVPIFNALPEGEKLGQCFPGGHSSGGYAWVALYYFFLQEKPQYRKLGLAIGLGLGGLFSLTQQFRGAHFFSHGIWSLAISWFVATAYYYLLFVRNKVESQPVREQQLA
ncbi:PAP2 (acid phosphatase) superfamily protein [Shewanella psychrophila]|uniref:PAP2 (Acid phosphatase) superfamily protein n=1 Tax=Shewanella psychrophila TaxID=225848 RepID=A0A1S6HUN3_9GAMM|nr:phosphatase PAP2 family protein [Shewanella psychrophila]AQS39276.1 PAP2 (acid phosphatase) superfamily protein [Shewanella psychrophila]